MPTPNRREFVYSDKLKGRSIRLLRINKIEICNCGLPPNDDEPQQCIHCSLETVQLKDNPVYDCLSYTWGEPLYQGFFGAGLQPKEEDHKTPRQPHIVCNNMVFIAQKNLYNALKQLLQHKLDWPLSGENNGYPHQDRIWIDAICINQHESVEKGSQINMMTEIYTQAQSVLVWLGPDCRTGAYSPPILSTGLKVLDVLASVPKQKHDIILPYSLGSPILYELLGIDAIKPREWDAFAEFILRGWFTRMWVVQETWAARNVVVFCGDNIIEWNKITAAVQTLIATKMDQLLNIEVIKAVGGFGSETRYIPNPISNQFIFQESRKHRSDLNLERLLAYSRLFNATMPEDKIFAIRGMWTPGRNLLGQDVSTLLPQSKEEGTVKHVYANATLVAMQEMGDINILSLVEHINAQTVPSNLVERIDYLSRHGVESSRVSAELSSWVPNYNSSPMIEPLNNVPRTLKEKPRWRASGNLKWESHKSSNDKTKLPVQGFCQDEIIERGATDIEIIQEHSMYTLLELLKNALDSTPRRQTMEQFWRALIKDTFRGKSIGFEAQRRFLYLILDPLRVLQITLSRLKRVDGVEEDNLKITHLQSILSKTEGLISDLSAREGSTMASLEKMQSIIDKAENLEEDASADWTEIWRCFRSAYMGRRMFRTKTNYIGISAQAIRNGDEIWILAGADVPMVLRKAEGDKRRKFVGEAYVFGMMEGEMVESATASRLTNIILE